jgi:hypothetical protein
VKPADDNATVVYEVNMEADAAIAGAFDTWLRDHIADLLQFNGFLSAEILEDRSCPPGKVRRIVQYRLRDQAALDDYLQNHAPRMRAQGVEKFGERFGAERRVLAHREEFIRGAVSTENCLNCGEVLTGQHCSHCGQRASVRVLSLWAMVKDVVGDALDWDSRLWRTLRPLAFKPGLLTQEFLRGRRASYTPPFRMYLILSVAFFLAASLGADPGSAFKFGIDGAGGANLQLRDRAQQPDQPGPAAAKPADPARPTPKLDPARQEIVDAIVAKLPPKDRARSQRDLEAEFAKMKPDEVERVKVLVDDPCGEQNMHVQMGPFGDKYGPRLRSACRKIVTDSQGFGRAVFNNIPKMMFIFLPLIAAVMYVLYLGSGRYYVEHLLFFVHFHAFFFLGGILIVLLDRGGALLKNSAAGGGLTAAAGVAAAAFAIYAPYYLYRAMRRVYGQGRIVTLLKYSLLGIGYLFFLTLTAVGLLFYTALTL